MTLNLYPLRPPQSALRQRQWKGLFNAYTFSLRTHRGQRTPSGQRCAARYDLHASSLGKRWSKALMVSMMWNYDRFQLWVNTNRISLSKGQPTRGQRGAICPDERRESLRVGPFPRQDSGQALPPLSLRLCRDDNNKASRHYAYIHKRVSRYRACSHRNLHHTGKAGADLRYKIQP
jgi:hypothetical protein